MQTNLLPGFGSDPPPEPEPPPPPPTREDPEVKEARADQRRAEKRRKGRRASILTSGEGVEDDLGSSVSRPQAGGNRGGAQVLGG